MRGVPGRHPIGDRAMTSAERHKRWHDRQQRIEAAAVDVVRTLGLMAAAYEHSATGDALEEIADLLTAALRKGA